MLFINGTPHHGEFSKDENEEENEEGRMGPNSIRVPVASNYDLDNDYDYIMTKALKSYKLHREQEKAESRRGLLKNHYIKRHYPRPKTAPPARFAAAMRTLKAQKAQNAANAYSVLMPKVDAIAAVQKANTTEDRESASQGSRRVLQVATVNLAMMEEDNKKAKSFLKRNNPAHPWYSYSYPTVSHMQKFIKPQSHSLMTSSMGEPLRPSSSRRSASEPSRPPSAPTNKKYNYDGGLFTHPKNKGTDCFVIHPDWVSESMSIQKLSLTERTGGAGPSYPVPSASIGPGMTTSWPGRRCKSAPPPKFRNPITWDTFQS